MWLEQRKSQRLETPAGVTGLIALEQTTLLRGGHDFAERMEKMEGILVQKSGNVLYTVHVRPSENAREDYDTKLRKIIEKAMTVNLIDEESEFSWLILTG